MVIRRGCSQHPAKQPERPISELGRDLLALRAQIVASGLPLLSWDEVEEEVRTRRGGGDDDESDVR